MSVANCQFGRLVEAGEEFCVPYSHNGPPPHDTAWKRGSAIYVDSEDFVELLQKSPLFRADGIDLHRRVELHLARPRLPPHHLLHEVTNVKPGRRKIAEGFHGVVLEVKTEAARVFVCGNDDAVLVKRNWSCKCGSVLWEEKLTLRSLRAKKVVLTFAKLKKHVGCNPAKNLTKAEYEAIKDVSSSPSASPSMVGRNRDIPVSGEKAVRAARRILPVSSDLRDQAKHALREGRKDSQSGLPPFTAVTVAVNERLDESIRKGTLDDFRILSFRPALLPTQPWSILVKQKDALKLYAEHATRTGLNTDEKINCTQDGNIALTLFVTSQPKKPQVAFVNDGKREVVTLEMAQTQHSSRVLFLAAATRISAEYCKQNRDCIVQNLPCTSSTCAHKTEIKTRDVPPGDDMNQSRGFELHKPECITNYEQYPPMTHDTEGSDLCSATMSSHFRERRDPTGPLRLKRLVLCYYHSVNAYAEAAVRHFGIGSNPCLLDRAQRYPSPPPVTSLTRSTASSLYLSAHTRKGEPREGSPERVHSSWYNPREVKITQTRIDYSTTKSSNKTGNYY